MAPVMSEDSRQRVTALLTGLEHDPAAIDRRAAVELLPLVYDELRDLARRFLARERRDHTLQPTALVHEAYLRLVDQERVAWRGRTHFLAVGAQAMRRLLVDHARGRKRIKRGGHWRRVTLDDRAELLAGRAVGPADILALEAALEKLADLDPTQVRVVELRFFGGLKVGEVAEILGVSKRTVEGHWTHARAWLRRELSGASGA